MPEQFAEEYLRAVQVLRQGGDGGAAGTVAPCDVRGSEAVVTEDGHLVCVQSRGEAEAMLVENGGGEGLFLVRPKAGQAEGWVLSFVQQGKISHQKIERGPPPRSLLTVGGLALGACAKLQDLVAHLRLAPGYFLGASPYQAQTWYHGPISREEAEVRLLKLPLDGATPPPSSDPPAPS